MSIGLLYLLVVSLENVKTKLGGYMHDVESANGESVYGVVEGSWHS